LKLNSHQTSNSIEYFLKKLLTDPDINISQAAQETLDEIEAVDFDDNYDNDDDEVPI